MQKLPQVFSSFLSFLNLVMKSVSTEAFKSQAKANHYLGENLIARDVN